MMPWTAAEQSNPPATSTQPGRAQVVDQIKEVAAPRVLYTVTDDGRDPASGRADERLPGLLAVPAGFCYWRVVVPTEQNSISG
jgi:hypothetical protein